ncbi:MAG: tetratricopeptide repeat protein [Planctomycetota bacterium]
MRHLGAGALLILMLGCRVTAVDRWVAGKRELRAGDYESAIVHFHACTKKDPDFAPAYLGLAAACTQQGDFPAVAGNLEKYLERNPKHGVAHLYLAECLFQMNENERARNHYLQFIDIVQEEVPTDHDRLIHCYQRMVELAVRRGDLFEEELYSGLAIHQRGCADRIGRAADAARSEKPGEPFAAALDRLNQAKMLRPSDPVLKRAIDDVLRELAASEGIETSHGLKQNEAPQAPIDPSISSLMFGPPKKK